MKQAELTTFISIVESYFQSLADEPAQIGVPYLLDGREPALEYTGIIGVSGRRKGVAYVTAGRATLDRLVRILTGSESADALALDMVGELANVLAGNLGRAFESDFDITVPVVVKGAPDQIVIQKLKQPGFVVPISWCGADLYIVIGID